MDKKTIQKILKKTKKDYGIIARDFSITRNKVIWSEIDVLVKKYVKDNQKILDVGCGNGRLFSILKDKNIDYLGTDNCKELVDIASEKYKDCDRGRFEVEDLLEMNFDKEFDVVFIIAVLQHIPSEELRLEALKKIKRVLKPGGYLLMLNWNFFQKNKIKYVNENNKSLLEGKSDLDKNDTLIPWREFRNSYKSKDNKSNKEILRYYHAFIEEETKDLLEKAGFEIEDIYYVKKGERSDVNEGYNICVVARAS